MAIYMKVPSMTGNVTATGYHGWIEIDSLEFGAERNIMTQPGNVYDRIRSDTNATEMFITKPLDKTSTLLFSQACVGKALDEIKIDVCQTADQPNPYAQYRLDNVIVSAYSMIADSKQKPLEQVSLNFTGLELRYTPHDERHRPGTPLSTRANIASQHNLHYDVCRNIQDGTPAGFNLFVATVYGEVGGVSGAPEAVGQAVGSVIINRVRSGFWRHRLTTASVIEHTGFNAYTNPWHINWNHINFRDPHVRRHQQFVKAIAMLNNQQINHKIAMDRNERAKLGLLENALQNVYYRRAVTTTANYYYSPQAMFGRTPGFLRGLSNHEQYRVAVPGAHPHEIKFYNIPTQVERRAGAQ